ncbi:MAG: hypothetical protein AAF611_14855 [Bacteroidota bacterium]
MKKELIFIGFVLLLFYGIHGFPTDMETLTGVTTIDVNVYDTYFVIESNLYLIFTLLFTFSITYLIRILVTRFENQIANYIYLISNGLFIVALVFVIRFFNTMLRDFQEEGLQIDQVFYNFFYFTTALFIFSVIFEIYVLFKIRKQSTT